MMTETHESTAVAESFTFAQHQALAQAWLRWNGKRGTETQALALMRKGPRPEALRRMLLARGLSLPLGCK